MAASTFSPGGFSYAQAAKGRSPAPPSQTPSSKVTSGAATPATGTFSELTSGSNWADDVEINVGEKKNDGQAEETEKEKPSELKDALVERAKAEESQQIVSVASSPDMTASSSTATKDDDASSAPNATSSESTWETKSQTSATEPAWIADRTARQNNEHQGDKEGKKKETSKEAPSVPQAVAVVLQEAPIPENFWTKRAAARTQEAPRPVVPITPANNAKKENQPPHSASHTMPHADAQLSPSETGNGNANTQNKPVSTAGKRPSENRSSVARHNSRWTGQDRHSDSPLPADAKAALNQRGGPSATSSVPPSVNDQTSWPTPETAEKERKESTEKDGAEKLDEKHEEDSNPAPKRKKSEWTPMAITPTFIYDTTGTNKPHEKKAHALANAETGPRGTNGARGGRGGFRRPNGGDRFSRSETAVANGHTDNNSTSHEKSQSQDRATMPPPPRPAPASSLDAAQLKNDEPMNEGAAAVASSSESKERTGPLPNGPSTTAGNSTKAPFDDRRARVQRRSELDAQEDVVPKPIPRRTSPGVMMDSLGENGPKGPQRAPPIRKVTSDRATDNRGSVDNIRDGSFVPAPRGGKRNGRGRGGARDMANGHIGAPALQGGGTLNDLPTSPAGPHGFQGSYHGYRGNHQFSFPPARGSYRGNPRSQSIPVENYFNPRFSNTYGSPQQTPPQLQTYWQPGMADMQPYSMSAAPMLQGDTGATIMFVKQQVEYYFSIENLAKDLHLRKHMDSQGFVPLQVIADFPRVKHYTQGDKELVKAACMSTDDVDVRVGEDGQERIRRRRDWEGFVMPVDERHATARNAGPERLDVPDRPQILTNNLPAQFRGPQSAGLPAAHHRYDRRSYDSGFPPMDPYLQNFYGYGAFPPEMFGVPMNGDETRGRSVRSPMHENITSPSQQPAAASFFGGEELGDFFSDEQMNVLTVVVTMTEERQTYHTLSSRTFSNGSIDSRHTLSEPEQGGSGKAKPMTNGDSHINGSGEANGTQTPSTERKDAGSDVGTVYWVKDQETSVENLPQGLVPYPYLQLRDEALQQRAEAVTGNCPKKLDILYQFWSHFLIRNFNASMYAEFKRLAWEDGRDRYTFIGLENLAKFFHESLINKKAVVREQIANDYVDLVNNMPKSLKDAPFRNLRSAWRDGSLNLKSRKKLSDVLDPNLKARLDEQFTPGVEASVPVGTV